MAPSDAHDFSTEQSLEDMTPEDRIREKMIFLFKIYPILMPTMLQMGLGPSVKPSLWRPILDQLVAEGILRRRTQYCKTWNGQERGYQCIEFTDEYLATLSPEHAEATADAAAVAGALGHAPNMQDDEVATEEPHPMSLPRGRALE